MPKGTSILIIVLTVVVVGGVVYMLRPGGDVNLSRGLITPTPSTIDDTVQFPPPTPSPMSIQPISQPVEVTLKTSKGDVDMVLDGARAPITVGNFVTLALDDYYDETIFHRVIPGFMIQGGDPTGTGTGGPGYQFQDEINDRKIVRGSVAMANAGPNTNGSQFFIVVAPATTHLDGLHTNFGQVANEESMEIVDAIVSVETGPSDKPMEDVVIQDVMVHNVTKAKTSP